MKLKPKFTSQTTNFPHIEGDILLYNYYNCEVTLTPSGIRSLQTGSRNIKILWEDFQSYIVPHYAEGFSPQYTIRCTHDTLRKAVKLARLGFDVDLRAFSGENAEPLNDIKPLLETLPLKALPEIVKYFEKIGLSLQLDTYEKTEPKKEALSEKKEKQKPKKSTLSI